MQSFPVSIVADAGPLIALARIDFFATAAKLFPRILVPDEVLAECLRDRARADSQAIQSALDQGILTLQAIPTPTGVVHLADQLGQGESAAIALAFSTNSAILLDEKKGRRAARRLGLRIAGTGAVLIAAKLGGFTPAVRPLLEQLKTTGYWLSEALASEILLRCGESQTPSSCGRRLESGP